MIEYYEYNEKWLEDMELKIISLLDEQDISYIDENIVVEDEKNGKYNIPIVVNVEKNIPTKDNVSIFLLSIL
ncbi:MAG: hypothetical protein LBU14_06310 [Candidatus Peribacteria bacterium]|jgi:hypothetical protein|nr:hypothetical protein [Candidatus Peribacteria bacterium]